MMCNRLFARIRGIILRYHLNSLKGVALFALITIAIHITFIYWAGHRYRPLGFVMEPVEQFLMNQVYMHSVWINQHIFNLEVIPLGDVLFFTNHTHITINIGCSGFKQMLHLGILFMVYPGPWRKKLWFIPLGIVIMHLINLFRLVGLSLILQSNPEYFAQAHDNFFRPLFYILIFGMWIWWTEKLTKKEIK